MFFALYICIKLISYEKTIFHTNFILKNKYSENSNKKELISAQYIYHWKQYILGKCIEKFKNALFDKIF